MHNIIDKYERFGDFMKIEVIYWSGTGNTEAMANILADAAKEAGADVSISTVSNTTVEKALSADVLALGCSSMGDEVLEESEMEPFVTSIENSLSGKKVALFGSYGWGDGAWMRDWTERLSSKGAIIINGEGFIAQDAPDDDAAAGLKDLGKALVGS